VPETIPIQHAQSLLRLSKLPTDELKADLQALKLPLVLLKNKALPNARLSVDDYGRLFIHLIRKLQLDLHQGTDELQAAIEFSAYRMLYLAMAHSGNLQQALQRAAVYFRPFEPRGERFRLIDEGELTYCRFDFGEAGESSGLRPPENFDMGQLNWLHGMTGSVLSVSMWHRLCSWFIGSNIDLASVDLAQPEARDSTPFVDLFSAPLNFATDAYGFRFNARYLTFPIVQGEDAVNKLLQTYPAELLRLDPVNASLGSRVKNLLGTDLNRDLPTLQDIADRLFMTTPTLHRRLKEEGTSYQQIKDHYRRDIALEKLRSGAITSSQLAELLGFSDSSTFHRAFKKWTGQTPLEYREQQLNNTVASKNLKRTGETGPLS
jgi:AraC-like DNA-binding protein